jgi:peptidoglycan/xylan/chitin deacetylase (PgdA/CDA1 family)
MIGVVAKGTEIKAVHEFFQLFKTPWEFYVPRHSYDVLIVTSDELPPHPTAKVLAIYNSKKTGFESQKNLATRSIENHPWLVWDGVEFPVYGDVLAFEGREGVFLKLKGRADAVGLEFGEAPLRTFRVGYDLFQEVSYLLTQGQPGVHAHLPTLEIHIALLRSLMVNSGISFVEVPAVPAGYDFMACLTHDVDFVGIRQHKFDHTMWGFLYRALVGSLLDFLRGKTTYRKLAQNSIAAFSLPLVFLGLRSDFWVEFDRYLQIERELGSTFFFIPYKNLAGEHVSGQASKLRAAKYDVTEIKEQVRELVKNGCEVGLHGIDAWNNPRKGRDELGRITGVTGRPEAGVRMHWLYFSDRSPAALEEAGFPYDSSFGYNDAVGFRAGTAQVFRPLKAETLLELPLNIQDTAMFYPDRMNLSEPEALESCKPLIQFTSVFGGALTVNWHTRSLSPERLWGNFYSTLLKEIQTFRVWFGRGEEIIHWFRTRRALSFDSVRFAERRLRLKLTGPTPNGQPPFVIRTYQPEVTRSMASTVPALIPSYTDTVWNGEAELEIQL